MDFKQFNELFPDSRYRLCRLDSGNNLSSDKAPIDNQIYPYERIANNISNRIGWIVPKDYIIIDIDDMNYAEKTIRMLKDFECKFMYNKSAKGMHLFFKNPKQFGCTARCYCSLGFMIDVRSMENGYIILPVNDDKREWGDYCSIEELEDLPYFLFPQKKVKGSYDFIDLKDGDGRNTMMFSFVNNLLNYGENITAPEIKKSLIAINKYYFKTPIPKEEMEHTILRNKLFDAQDRAEKKAAKEKKEGRKNISKEDLEGIAVKMLEKYHFAVLNKTPFMWNGKYYKRTTQNDIEVIIHNEYHQTLTANQRTEVVKFLYLKCQRQPTEFDKDWNKIALKNGVLNLLTQELEDFNPDVINTIYVDRNYNKNVEFSTRIDGFFTFLANNNVERKKLLYEMIGYTFYKRNLMRKMFIFKGTASTGKSTLLKIIQHLLGKDNYESIDLDAYDNDYYFVATMNKLAAIGDDINGREVKITGRLKKAVSGEEVSARQIYEAPVTWIPFATPIFAGNKIGYIDDKTEGLYSRLIMFNMDRPILKPNRMFMETITEADYEYLLVRSVELMRLALERNEFTVTIQETSMVDAFRNKQSSVRSYIAQTYQTPEKLHNQSVQSIFLDYKNNWGKDMKILSGSISFSEEIAEVFGCEVVRARLNNELTTRFRFKKSQMDDPKYSKICPLVGEIPEVTEEYSKEDEVTEPMEVKND